MWRPRMPTMFFRKKHPDQFGRDPIFEEQTVKIIGEKCLQTISNFIQTQNFRVRVNKYIYSVVWVSKFAGKNSKQTTCTWISKNGKV